MARSRCSATYLLIILVFNDWRVIVVASLAFLAVGRRSEVQHLDYVLQIILYKRSVKPHNLLIDKSDSLWIPILGNGWLANQRLSDII